MENRILNMENIGTTPEQLIEIYSIAPKCITDMRTYCNNGMEDPTEFSVCPFNSSHRILTFRMPAHVLKCRRNYSGPPLEACIYNACHLVPVGTMKAHLETCRERHLFHICDYEKDFRKEIS